MLPISYIVDKAYVDNTVCCMLAKDVAVFFSLLNKII